MIAGYPFDIARCALAIAVLAVLAALVGCRDTASLVEDIEQRALPCCSDTDCFAGRICVRLEGACALDGPASGLCRHPLAADDACVDDTECARDLVCGADGACLPPASRTDDQSCGADRECAEGLICAEEGTCRAPASTEPGATCGADRECMTGSLCEDGACRSTFGEACAPGTCAADLTCATDLDGLWRCLWAIDAPCSLDSTCAPPARCVDVESVDRCRRPLDASCGDDRDCLPGAACSETGDGPRCRLPRGASCSADEEKACQPTLVCRFPDAISPAECREHARTGDACLHGWQCAADLACIDGTCRLADGQPCDDDVMCQSGVCRSDLPGGTRKCARSGELGAGCDSGSDCSPPLRCEASSGTCKGDALYPCAEDLDCLASAGLVCRPSRMGPDPQPVCQLPGGPGSPCTVADGHCVRGQCAVGAGHCPHEEGGRCADEAACLGDLRCVPEDDERRCRAARPACAACDAEADCESGICQAGICLQGIGGACDLDRCCQRPEQVCMDANDDGLRTCERPQSAADTPCMRDVECGEAMSCLAGRCRVTDQGGFCRRQTDCGPGLRCVRDRCIAPVGLGDRCETPERTPDDHNCQPDLICNSVTFVCQGQGDGEPGEWCDRQIECDASLVCNLRTRRCTVP